MVGQGMSCGQSYGAGSHDDDVGGFVVKHGCSVVEVGWRSLFRLVLVYLLQRVRQYGWGGKRVSFCCREPSPNDVDLTDA